MPQAVKHNRWQVMLLDEPMERIVDGRCLGRHPQRPGEHQIVILVLRAQQLDLLTLLVVLGVFKTRIVEVIEDTVGNFTSTSFSSSSSRAFRFTLCSSLLTYTDAVP